MNRKLAKSFQECIAAIIQLQFKSDFLNEDQTLQGNINLNELKAKYSNRNVFNLYIMCMPTIVLDAIHSNPVKVHYWKLNEAVSLST